MHHVGDDFYWTNADKKFERLEYLMDHINENQEKYNINVFFSTLSNYT